MVGPVAKHEGVAHLQAAMGLSERRACSIVGADRKMIRYRLYQDAMIGTDHRLMAEARMRARAVARSSSAMSRAQIEWVLCRPPDTELRTQLRDLANERKRFGYRRLFVLLRQEGEPSGINRIYRLYREEGLTVRKRRARRRGGIADADPGRIQAERSLVGGFCP